MMIMKPAVSFKAVVQYHIILLDLISVNNLPKVAAPGIACHISLFKRCRLKHVSGTSF